MVELEAGDLRVELSSNIIEGSIYCWTDNFNTTGVTHPHKTWSKGQTCI